MKTAIKLTLALALMMSTTSLFAQKFGRINTTEIVAAMPEMVEFQKNMEEFGKTLQDGIEAIGVEFQTKLQDYQKNSATYSESIREMKERELQELSTRREQYQQAAQQDYERRYNELMSPIIEKARAAIDKISAAGGYIAIFDTSAGSLVYFDEVNLTDIAPQVKAELGIAAQ